MANLNLPAVGDPGPDWAFEINAAFDAINTEAEANTAEVTGRLADLPATSEDLNGFLSTGWVRTSGTALNRPITSDNSLFVVQGIRRALSDAGAQVAYGVNLTAQGRVWFRTQSTGTWGAWTELAISDPNMTVARVEDAGVYPPRIEGRVNLYIGETNPSAEMGPEDVWFNTETLTETSLQTSLETIGDPIRGAVQAISQERVIIPTSAFGPIDISPAIWSSWYESSASLTGSPVIWFEDPSVAGFQPRAGAVVTIPDGWNTGRVRLYYAHEQSSIDPAARAVDMNVVVFPAGAGADLSSGVVGGGVTETLNLSEIGQNIIGSQDFNIPVDPVALGARIMRLNIRRLPNSGSPFLGRIGIVGVELERTS